MTAEQLAVAFGLWARERLDVDWRGVSPGFAHWRGEAKYRHKSHLKWLSDEEGLLLDGCLQTMKQYAPSSFKVFFFNLCGEVASGRDFGTLAVATA